ncbi:MAG: hypothetical protein V7K55_25550 [Nostoc sp.]|uniref:hypothetical protein n=1 Tax=Nostoc sp. TaxID=1180 RepID=UPI002FF496F5
MLNTTTDQVSVSDTQTKSPRLWIPERVLFTPAALDEDWGQQMQQLSLQLTLIVMLFSLVLKNA